MPEQLSIFTNVCWRCWPAISCKCQSDDTEVARLRGEIFLLDRELQRENRRAREFSDALRSLASDVWKAREDRMSENGLDDLPEDVFKLGEQAQEAMTLFTESRNQDRVSALYQKFEARAALAAAKPEGGE